VRSICLKRPRRIWHQAEASWRDSKILRRHCEILKNAMAISRQGEKAIIFKFIDVAKENIPVTRLYQLLHVGPSGYLA
jgi:hypothetical protein